MKKRNVLRWDVQKDGQLIGVLGAVPAFKICRSEDMKTFRVLSLLPNARETRCPTQQDAKRAAEREAERWLGLAGLKKEKR